MIDAVFVVIGFAVGGGFAAWRLKGNRSTAQAVKAVIMGGGGPGERESD